VVLLVEELGGDSKVAEAVAVVDNIVAVVPVDSRD
jgi:hypothetical protein